MPSHFTFYITAHALARPQAAAVAAVTAAAVTAAAVAAVAAAVAAAAAAVAAAAVAAVAAVGVVAIIIVVAVFKAGGRRQHVWVVVLVWVLVLVRMEGDLATPAGPAGNSTVPCLA